jgi:hypothetical protein
MNLGKKIAIVLLAGATGGLANSLAVWGAGVLGITPALGFNMTPLLTLKWVLPRILASAVWGLLFLIPFWKETPYKKGAVLSLAPYFFMLFVFFPKMKMGLMGLKLGPGAPVFALLFLLLWGLVAAFVVDKLVDD